ncbi:rhodanese-like domain-containing protein [Clostridiaceae bacterium 35-E11]
MRKSVSVIALILILVLSIMTGCAKETSKEASEEKQYQYYTAEQLKQGIEEEDSMFIVDIQVKEEFDQHHIKGVIATYAYPVKTEEDKAKLDAILPQLKENDDPIVIVCPRGGGGAEKTYNHLLEQGIEEERLYILQDGQAGWPYEELLEK